MTKYQFEIQSSIEVETEAETVEEARRKIISNLEDGDYDEELSSGKACVSQGREVK